jgi:hypothetical protein
MRLKFRAEGHFDVDALIRLIPRKELTSYEITPHESFPDETVVLNTKLSLSAVKKIIETIDDGHVMLETIQLEKNYTGERSYGEPVKKAKAKTPVKSAAKKPLAKKKK